MPRSPRAQSVLLAAFAVVLLVTGTAFASTFGAQLTWQQRDAVAVSVDGYAVSSDGGTPTVRVRLRVDNPLGRPIELAGTTLVVYDGEEPFRDDDHLTLPRTATLAETTVPPGGERAVTVTMEVAENRTTSARTAIANGSASASGTLDVRLVGREFSVDV